MITEVHNDKHYLVTGVTSGIGKAVAEQLLLSGAFVFGIGRDVNKLKGEKCFSNNIKFTFCSLDLEMSDFLDEHVVDYVSRNEKFSGLVHCAGREETIPIQVYSTQEMESLFRINVFSGMTLLRAFSKKKICKINSSLVFMSSVMGELGQPGKTGYCASKAAVLGMVKSAALEFAKRNIRVNAVSPGVVNTPMTLKLFSSISEDNVKKITNMHPLGIGEVEDVVPVILFLLSDEAKWITGQNLVIDGGYSIQ